MSNRICPKCSTENEEEYIYCKNCGTQLAQKSDYHTKPEQPNQQSSTYSYQNSTFNAPNNYSICGIPAEEIGVFIGKNSENYLSSFLKMEITNSNVSWCWSVAVLTFFFGPIGAGIWYYYRKMFKKATLFTVIGVILVLLQSFLIFSMPSNPLTNALSNFNNTANIDMTALLESLKDTKFLILFAANSLLNLLKLAFMVYVSLYARYHYKKHCINKISLFRNTQADPRFYRFGIAAVGGVSVGASLIAVVAYFAASFAESLISLF